MVTFYRAVSFAELADLRRVGRFRAGSNSSEGKHLAFTAADAHLWGLATGFAFVVIRVEVPDEDCLPMYRWARLDGIGPAAFATISLLERARFFEDIESE